jgi:hypothetical protein
MGLFNNFAPGNLNFNPFESMHGGETDANGEYTERGKNDFFAPIWSDRTKNEWSKFLKGDYTLKDYLSPGGVLANPAQQIADPGNFFTTTEHENWFNGEGMSSRTQMSAIIAALIYGGAALGAGSGAAGEGGAVSAAGGAGAEVGTGTAGAGATGVGTSEAAVTGGGEVAAGGGGTSTVPELGGISSEYTGALQGTSEGSVSGSPSIGVGEGQFWENLLSNSTGGDTGGSSTEAQPAPQQRRNQPPPIQKDSELFSSLKKSRESDGSHFLPTPTPTPIGEPGPDSVVTKQTTEGTTVTMKKSKERQIDPYASDSPLESLATSRSSTDQQKESGSFYYDLLG